MAFDGFVTKAIVNELKSCLISGKINKIHQPDKDNLILNIYSNGQKYNLAICINASNCRMNLTSETKQNPNTPTSFCMLLRKHLIGFKITNIDSNGLDRIVSITLEGFNELNDISYKKLIIELMGKHSNIILLNENDIIVDSARHIASERCILPANPYQFPSSEKLNIYSISLEEFLDIIHNSKENFTDTISNLFYGFSKSHIHYIIKLLNIKLEDISSSDISRFYLYIINLISDINNFKIDIREINIHHKKDYVLISSENPSKLKINSFLDNYYSLKEKKEFLDNYRNNVLRIILGILKKYQKRLLNIDNKLSECKDMEKYKLYGELITANLYRLENNQNLESVVVENYYDNNIPITIALDKKYSLAINAKNFFKKYNKLKNTLLVVTKQKEETKKELDYIESIIYSLNSSFSLQDVDDIYLEIQESFLHYQPSKNKSIKNNKDSHLSPIALEVDGYTILIGKNNRQNDYLTFKLASKNDLWFHVQDAHGSHVILQTNGKEISDDNPIIVKCAELAGLHSKSNTENKVAVNYTLIKNVKKPKGSNPGFVTFTNYKTILVKPKNCDLSN